MTEANLGDEGWAWGRVLKGAIMHSLNFKASGRKKFKKGGSLEMCVFYVCLFMISGGINQQSPGFRVEGLRV